MRTTIFILICAAAVLLSACGTMSRNECINADWRLIGYEDGAKGAGPELIGEHRKACANHDVTPDKTAYDEGYREGIAAYCNYSRGQRAGSNGEVFSGVCPSESEYRLGYDAGIEIFCTYDRGYSTGLAGRSYRRVCPHDLEADFLAGYDHGRQIHLLEADLRAASERLAAVIEEQEDIEKRAELIRGQIAYDEELTGPQRAELLEELESGQQRSAELAVEEVELAHEIDHLQLELERIRGE